MVALKKRVGRLSYSVIRLYPVADKIARFCACFRWFGLFLQKRGFDSLHPLQQFPQHFRRFPGHCPSIVLYCRPDRSLFWGFLPRDRIRGITVANVLCLPVGSLKPPDTFIQTSYSRSPHSCLAPVGPWPCDTWRVLSMACLVVPAVTSSFSKRRLWPRRLPVRRSRHWKGRRTPGAGACLLRACPGFGDRGGQTGRHGGSASPPPHA